jgi:multifunctional 2-oxoglutarate metabolism enzyme
MSAVSSESHEPAVEPGHPAAGQADFGANEWLVEELYQRYLADPGSVDRAWWSFFADYQPTLPNGTAPQSPQPQTPAPAPAPAPPAPPAQ